MSDNATPDEEETEPNEQQDDIITSDSYPMRVLAGAGTGKTYTMVEKIERLLDEQGVPPEDILALTFTNQAAESMRTKLAEKVGPRANDIDAYTYHAIGREILSEFGYYGDFDPRASLVGEADRLRLIYECLEDIEYDFSSPGVNPPGADWSRTEGNLSSFISEAKSEGITPGELDEYLPESTALVHLGDLPERIESDASEYLRAETSPSSDEEFATALENLEAFVDSLQEHRAQLGTSGAEADVAAFLETFIDLCRNLEEAFHEHEAAIIDGSYQAFAKLPAFLFGGYSGAPSGIEKPSTIPLDRLRSFIDELQDAHDFTAGYESYERRLDAADSMDFDDLVIEAKRLIATNETVRDWVTQKWSYVFCDEFQDTDSIQFELVQHLANDANLFVVGDDDQSIYEWRGANASNITDDFRAAYPDFADFRLEYNYRSRKPILDLVDDALEELPTREVEKELKPTEDRAHTGSGVAVFQEDDAAEEAQQIAAAISGLQAGEAPGIPDQFDVGDTAVLVRQNDHIRPIRRALDEAGIPYELVGGLATQSTAVDTVTAFLRALVNHDDEVSLNRVLMLCYRVPEADLDALNRRDERLWDALLGCAPNDFTAPKALRTARNDLRALDRIARTQPLSSLYEAIKERADLELFCRTDERRELRYFDELIEQFDDGPIEAELDEAFIDYLEYAATGVSQGGGSTDQPEVSDDVVTLMTVHKAKGLEFPVVFIPRLNAREWRPRDRNFSQMMTAFDDSDEPYAVDFVRRARVEQQRVFHVAATRAEEVLVLSGTAAGGGETNETVSVAAQEELYPDPVEWSETESTFDIWELVRANLPTTAVDWTGHTWETTNRDQVLRDGEQTYDRQTAISELLSITQQALAGTLPSVAPAESDIGVTGASISIEPSVRQTFSYTSVDTHRTCARQYYLEQVVGAFDDALFTTDSTAGASTRDAERTVSRREVGVLFHQTAAAATTEGYTSPAAWRDVANDIASGRPRATEDTLSEVYACIDRYFDSVVSEWDLVAAERRFELEFPLRHDSEHVYPVVGAVDAIYRDHDGNYTVIDYKTGQREGDYDLQRAIYVLAANQFISDDLATHRENPDVNRAGILHLGPDATPPYLTETRYSDGELDTLDEEIATELGAAAQATYDEYTDDKDVCEYCPHASLPCSHADD